MTLEHPTPNDDDRILIDASDLTLAEYGEIEELLDAPLEKLLEGTGKWKAIAAMAWILRRRTDPTYTLEQANALKMRDLELVAPPDPTVGEPSGVPPRSSPESGTSIRSVS